MKKQHLGQLGEKLAAEFLKKNNYRIVEKNYRCPHGEIDIIATKKDTLIFVEVRTKASSIFGTPEESITAPKKEKLVSSALYYCSSHPDLPENWRIDFIAVELDRDQAKLKRIEHMENAIS